MKKILLLLLFIPLVSLNAQNLSYGNEIDAIEICRQLSLNSVPEPLDQEIDEILNKIISITGLEKNFHLQICANTKNASALSYYGVRYIFYDKQFLESISGENRWFVTYVLAHEIAHHLNSHTKDAYMYLNGFPNDITLDDRRSEELEADKWAGFILGKLGASFEETVGAVRQLPDDENEDPYSSHPHEQLRVEAVVEGYNNAVGGLAGLKLNEFEGDNNAKAYIYYYNAREKYSEGDIDGALIDINKAIVNKRGFPAAYIVRAQLKNELGDPYGSIGDLNDAIRLNPNLDDLYVERGISKVTVGQYDSALDDFNYAISINNKSLRGYFNKAVLLFNSYLGVYNLNTYISFTEIIQAFDKTIEIYPNYLEARTFRAQTIIQKLSSVLPGNSFEPYFDEIKTALNDLDTSIAYIDDYEFTTNIPKKLFLLNNYSYRASINANIGNYPSVISDVDFLINNSKDFVDEEIYLEHFAKANFIKYFTISETDYALYYDISDICNHLNNFVNVMKSFFKSGNIENELANNIYNKLVDEYQKNECMKNNKKQ